MYKVFTFKQQTKTNDNLTKSVLPCVLFYIPEMLVLNYFPNLISALILKEKIPQGARGKHFKAPPVLLYQSPHHPMKMI